MHRVLRIREADRSIFNDLKSGKKRVETRAATSLYKNLARGDTVTFVCGKSRLTKTISKVYRWKSIDAIARQVNFKHVMPEVSSLAEMKRVYARFPKYADKIRLHGLLGLEFATIRG
jgi:ASC-1-like (ASCH) protein